MYNAGERAKKDKKSNGVEQIEEEEEAERKEAERKEAEPLSSSL
jgi:hypothetical protein